MREFLFSVFALECVRRAKSKDYLHRLCSLIHRLYFMHFVTRFKGGDPNTDRRHGGRLCVLAGFHICSLKKPVDVQIIWCQQRVE